MRFATSSKARRREMMAFVNDEMAVTGYEVRYLMRASIGTASST